MVEFPQTREMTIHVPQATKRYFYELVAGGCCIVVATVIALTMMYQVLDEAQAEWLRMIYFLVIALAFAVLIAGFRIVIDSESERPLAAPHKGREWVMDPQFLTISLALLEGKDRATLRRFKTGALRLEWADIIKVIFKEKTSRTEPACFEIHVQHHEETLGQNAVLRIRRDLLEKQEARIIDFFRRQNVKIELPNPSSQSAG